MGTDELRDYPEASWPLLKQSILEGSYLPQPVRKIVIPKPQGGDGKFRNSDGCRQAICPSDIPMAEC